MIMAGTPVADFGKQLKRARETRGISLRQIAAVTKISVGALEALERNDISRLPGGIFSRGIVRSYALEVGLDAEQTVREFIEKFPHDSVTAGSPHVPQEDHAAIESERESAATAVTLVGISIPIIGIILYMTLWSPRTPARPPDAARVAPADQAAAIQVAAEPLRFELAVSRAVHLEIDVDGIRHDARDLVAGERLAFDADHGMRLTVSDAAAVQLSINGQPAVPLGDVNQARTVEIDRRNYASFLASQ